MPRVRVRSHVRRLSDGSVTRVREHFRGTPSPAAMVGAGGAALVVLIIVGLIFLWPNSPDPQPALSAQRTAAPPTYRAGVDPRLATSLREVRRSAGVSLEDAAARSGVPRSRITRFESGSALPDARELDALCRTYDLTPEVRNELMDLQWNAANRG
ncbi:helix-turn-helix transcriptional regulator [Sphaerisporangium sp. B11E5]|uniref:helix-turn-helix domain-containing protein n=1 Tax=Sphaerisporangium sp. B11E5 TaxID=3153563 RepID=UPI00325D8D13